MIPSKDEALEILVEGHSHNPGPWLGHSKSCAHCAYTIAKACGMDADKAYVFGLLHDIGRRFGKRHLGHVSDGYSYMMSLGFDEVARICLTHSFMDNTINDYVGNIDTSEEEMKLITGNLEKIVFDDYDLLIHLCDAMAGSEGVLDIEERMDDVERRYGAYPIEKRIANRNLIKYFEEKARRNIYEITQKDTFRVQ